MQLDPGKYYAVSDADSGMSLPNTAATVELLTKGEDVVFEVPNYTDLGEDVAWAKSIEGVWYATFTPTPGEANVITSEKPCPVGEVRNTETRKCSSTINTSVSTQIPCAVGLERNPETGRCRKIATVAASPAACKAGQVRNVTTNRCNNVATSKAIKTCPIGQERNSETGRCKKSASKVATDQNVKDVASRLVKNNASWWFAGFGVVGSVGYGIYEWRRDILLKLLGIKQRFFGQG